MDILLDTHAIIWFFNGDEELSLKAKKMIVDTKNKKFVSIASVWEVAIKLGLKKLVFDGNVSEVAELIELNGFHILPISIDHIVVYETLDLIHRDPFDRILVAQAIVDRLTIITKDEHIQKYKVLTNW
jgi:PIN domain nuclease of toxin-antitoxin system